MYSYEFKHIEALEKKCFLDKKVNYILKQSVVQHNFRTHNYT